MNTDYYLHVFGVVAGAIGVVSFGIGGIVCWRKSARLRGEELTLVCCLGFLTLVYGAMFLGGLRELLRN